MTITRRNLLRSAAILTAGAVSPNIFAQDAPASPPADAVYSRMLNWHVGPTFYSFHRFPFDEGLKKCQLAGATSFGLKPGLKLTKDTDATIGPGMSKENFKFLRELIAASGCVPQTMGVCPADRKHFEFAASLGIPNIDSEPGMKALDEVNRLAEEYKINVGLHNHPKPSTYADPDVLLEQLKNCGSRVGACTDIGHWLRSGFDPLECFKKLRGRISSFHIKDLTEQKRDVPLGRGVCQVADILREAVAQGFQGPITIEYESNWSANEVEIAECVAFIHRTAREILMG